MKTIIQGFFCMLFIHIIIFMYTIGWPYAKMKFDELNRSESYVATSQTDFMLIGFVGSPVALFSITVIGGTIICSIVISLIKKLLGLFR
ncbi:hypothetical protein [Solibacillus sp. FSL K6-1523]|uniref:hypothetical protein n=1 Tax=Solibacillus sp. FSL K6-1523 TaxID=2921471 RepID=UPI0030F58E70